MAIGDVPGAGRAGLEEMRHIAVHDEVADDLVSDAHACPPGRIADGLAALGADQLPFVLTNCHPRVVHSLRLGKPGFYA